MYVLIAYLLEKYTVELTPLFTSNVETVIYVQTVNYFAKIYKT